MGIVHHHTGAVLFCKLDNLRQLRYIAAHREDTVCNDQAAAFLGNLLQLTLQILHIRMAVAQHLTVAELTSVIDRSVILTVADHVVVGADDRGDDAKVGLEAGREGNDHFLMQEPGQLGLQLQMELQSAVQESGAGAAGAVLFEGLDTGFNDFRIRRQPEIVVGAQHDPALALHDDLNILPGFQRMTVGIDSLLFQVLGYAWLVTLCKNIHKFTFNCRF